MNHYPIPRDYPEYQSPPEKVSDGRWFSIYAVLDAVFIVVALGLALWLAYILLVGSFVWSVKLVIPLTFGWATLAYLALPRLHQLFTLLYVPNYFIGRTKTVDGILGDPVNLAFDGTETDVHAAMRNAGWVPADPITLRSSWNIIISSVFGTSYPQAPVSNLISPTSRKCRAMRHSGTTCGFGGYQKGGCSQAGTGRIGWPPVPTTGRWGFPASHSNLPTRWMPTPTWSGTTL